MAEYKYVRKTIRYGGKRYEVTGKTELEALEKLAELKSRLKRGELTVGENMTVDAWYREWKALYKEPSGITDKSLSMYDALYQNYLYPKIGRMKLKDVRDVHLQKILNEQAGMSYSHVKKLRGAMMQLFSKARKSRLITYDPSEDLAIPFYTKRSRRALTDAERCAILEVAKNHRSGLWVLTMLYTGMRPGETAALQWADIDFGRNEIHVHAAKESGSSRIKGTKTVAGVRDIPIHAELRPLLLKVQGAPFTPVFPTARGNRQNDNSLRRLWTSFKRDLDIYMGATVYRNQIIRSVVADDLTPYCLRHTFCTDLQKAGVPINVAKELMGHADISTTANIYTHKDMEVLHTGISLLDGSGGKDGGKQNLA
uniref:Integrase n=1 Tax=Myoviridae sp. ctr0w28 TaxID=2826703 RepID=A0A8S5NSE9_9CAUD|nr:MAG TPA: Integrase [Myoviridae sp. ctr0w28]